ncbi:MAG: ACP S-malonyltransferase [Deltaproteobacteria bacterium]|nr:ACP S-malonyltransferase [Deltaproteobacteria bacterium]
MSIAFVFPGQGSQEVGMGRSLASVSVGAAGVFASADATFATDGLSMSSLCFEGPADALTLTENTQPALLTVSIAALKALQERLPSLCPDFVAGHSLGEYSACVCAGTLGLQDALRVVRSRGQAMQHAVAPGVGAMAAIMGVDAELLGTLCARAQAESPEWVVSPANFNAPGQIVIGGHAAAVERVRVLVEEARGRAILLKVSAPFHCSLMAPAAERVRESLSAISLTEAAIPIVHNVDACANRDPDRVREALVAQVAGAVLWEQSVRELARLGVKTLVELGPGRVLAGLAKRIDKSLVVHSVSDAASLDACVNALSLA